MRKSASSAAAFNLGHDRDLKVGQSIRTETFSLAAVITRFCTITDITVGTAENATVHRILPDGSREPVGVGSLNITTHSPNFGTRVQSFEPDALVRVAQTAGQKTETLNKALAHQDTLTKQGKPRKSARAAI